MTTMKLNFPDGHNRKLTGLQADELYKQYDIVWKNMNKHYDDAIERGIRQYDNAKYILNITYDRLRNMNTLNVKELKRIKLEIKGRERELAFISDSVFTVYLPMYDNKDFRLEKIQGIFESSDAYQKYVINQGV